uniref:G-protein coupled receptors family 1 profile domain-containing protein n=1 Tax=Caenorhabditis japonica TaxID=281687 RepID=A0A8R1DHT7_CAEJA
MNPSTFDTIKTTVQVTSVVLSWAINLFLIYLIVKKSNKKMGNYRHLMVFFCFCSICFSTMDVIIRPIIHSHKSAFFMMMDLRNRAIPVHVANAMVCVMAGCFGVIIYGIAIHFIFRYFALERHGRVKYFDKHLLLFWLTIPLLGGVIWTLVTLLLFPMSSTSSEYLR